MRQTGGGATGGAAPPGFNIPGLDIGSMLNNPGRLDGQSGNGVDLLTILLALSLSLRIDEHGPANAKQSKHAAAHESNDGGGEPRRWRAGLFAPSVSGTIFKRSPGLLPVSF